MKKILITGATGFVGRNFIPKLYKTQEFDTALLVRDVEKARRLFGSCGGINVIDLNEDNYKDTIKSFNPTIVLHMASYLTSGRNQEAIDKLIDVNISFGTHLLDAIQDTDIEYFINFGTFAEYLYEINELVSASLYAATKTGFRSIIDFYRSMFKFKWINVIPYSIYGAGDSQKKVIDIIIDSLEAKEPVKMTKGEQILDFIHVDDVCSFLEKLIYEISEFEQDVVELFLGTGKGTSIFELSKRIEAEFCSKANIEWGAVPYREKETMHSVADLEHNKLLGFDWSPSIDLTKGLHMLTC